MMECQSTDSGGSDSISESLSNDSLNHDLADNSAVTSGWQQSCLEQVPAVLPCCQTEQMSVAGFQLDAQTANEAQMIVSFCDSKQQLPELCEEPDPINNDKIVQFEEQSQSLGSVSDDLSVQVSMNAILELGADVAHGKPQKSSHPSHSCEGLLINAGLSVSNSNIVGEGDSIQRGVAMTTGQIRSETNNLPFKNSEEKLSNDERGKDDYRPESSNECHIFSEQLHQESDDVVEQLLQEIDSFGQSPVPCSSDQSLIDRQTDDQCFSPGRESEECDRSTEQHSNAKSSLHEDYQNKDRQLVDGSSSESQLSDGGGTSETDTSSQNTANEGVAIFTAEQITPDQLPAAYNVLVHRYLLLRQHRSEQLAIQRQMEEDHQAISARLASVVVERDRYLRKLDEYEDFSLADLEEVKQVSDFEMLIYNCACN